MTTTRYDDTMVDPLDATAAADADISGSETTGNRLGDAARGVAGTVSDAAATAGPKVKDAAGTTADAMREADRVIRTSSDQGLGMIGALSLGAAIGLLIGGANRFLVALALVPAVMVAKTIVERMDRSNVRGLGHLD
jgi:hypothetical protein